MECNKDEAIRAKEIAERRMQSGDFAGAKKVAQKARQLNPELENISQLLMVCEVHCSAAIKLNGSEMDWYGILQVEKFSDEAVIKKQYRKLALSLHPDKNKCAGAEAAFKLIGEANRVLTDSTKRSLYDIKCKGGVRHVAAPRPAPHQSHRSLHAKKEHATGNKFSKSPHLQNMSSHPYQQSQQTTFWTCCSSCNTRYQYHKEFQNKMLRCQGCQRSFLARDLGGQGVPNGSPWSQYLNQKGIPNQGPSKIVPQSNGSKSTGVFPDRFVGVDLMPRAGKAVDVGGCSKPEELKARNADQIGGGSKAQGKANGHVGVGVEAAKSVPVRLPKSDTTKPRESGTLKNARRKRRKSVDDSSESSDIGSSDDIEENGGNSSAQNSGPGGSYRARRSSRKKQRVSYEENLSDDDFVRPPPKKSNGSISFGVTLEEMKKASMDSGVAKEEILGSSAGAAVINGNKKEVKQKASSTLEESSLNKKSKTRGCKASRVEGSKLEKAKVKLENNDGKSKVDGDSRLNSFKVQNASMSDKADAKMENTERKPEGNDSKLSSDEAVKSEAIEYPDPDFSNFDKERTENCFATDQIWALYDETDGMPRFYARINKVRPHPFKLKITWLEACPDGKDEQNWCNGDLPVGCGGFGSGNRQTVGLPMFSHQMKCVRGIARGNYLIYPKKGEIWALFKDWDVKWCSEPEKHRPPYQFDFVEVSSDFDEKFGIGVSYLGKVRGFVSIFQQAARNGVISFCVGPGELYRFSHRIPSFKMTGTEGEGVPAGSFELDPCSLPSNLDDHDDLSNTMTPKENLDMEASCSTSPKNKLKPMKGPEKICTQKKHEKHETCSEKGTSVLGKSPTELNASCKDDHVSAWQLVKEAYGSKIVNHDKCTQDEGNDTSSQANQRIKTPGKREKNGPAADALQPRRSPRDLSKRDNQVNASQFTTKEDSDKFMTSVISPMSSGRRVIEVEPYDFKREKLEDKFQLDQIWALYSNEDGLPRNYGQVKKIVSSPDFRLHVAMLEQCTPPKHAMRPICCGTFKVNSAKTKVISPATFSHQLKAESVAKNRYEIHPRKGEIWAVYKNWNPDLTHMDQGVRECDIVEVLEENDHGIKAVVLMRAKGCESFYRAPRSQRSKTGVMDIARADFARFSHQCSAIQHTGEKEKHLRGYWELDPSSIPGTVILLD